MSALDEQVFREHVRAVVERGAGWDLLVEQLFPHLERLVGSSPSLGSLRSSEDHRRNAATEVLAKLAKNQHRALALLEPWLAINTEKTAADWIRIVIANVVRGYVARQIGSDARKRLLHTLATSLPLDHDDAAGLRPPVTTEQTAREILEFATEHLEHAQLAALRSWLHHGDFADIARAAGRTDPRDGERLVRAALAKLRREFA